MKILVSACILGDNCKYNGGNNYDEDVASYLKNHEVIKICPELLAGMSTPRACAELVNGVVMDATGKNVDSAYRAAVQEAMKQVEQMDIDLAVLQSRSPTCGVNSIYDGSFSGKLIKGQGLFAQALMKAGCQVIDVADCKAKIQTVDRSDYE